jgi:hypothetical protein
LTEWAVTMACFDFTNEDDSLTKDGPVQLITGRTAGTLAGQLQAISDGETAVFVALPGCTKFLSVKAPTS